MNKKWIKAALAGLALTYSFAANADGNHWAFFWGHEGTYVADLDLRPLGIEHTEEMVLVLHRNGTVNFLSEHELNDLSSSGAGVWERIGRNTIGIGVLMSRVGEPGPPTVCANSGAVKPVNCVLKFGAKMQRTSHGSYTGIMLLTVEEPEIPGEEKTVLHIPIELPFNMRRMDLSEFPGAL